MSPTPSHRNKLTCTVHSVIDYAQCFGENGSVIQTDYIPYTFKEPITDTPYYTRLLIS